MKRLLVSLFACVLAMVSASAYAQSRPDIMEIVTLSGIVSDGMADQVTKQVAEINENPRVKGVLLVVDSPGGGVLASAVIYEELSKLKVPVVGFCENICASGGMYVLMAPTVKYVGVRTSTISGSIGVIMHITRYNRLLDWAKVDNETYKSGRLKDSGNPTRGVTDEEREDLQGTVNTLAATFYGLVEKSRGAKIKNWDQIKSARIFFGADGVKAGLVDAVMSRDQAIAKVKELSGSKQIFTREELKKFGKDAADSGFSFVHEAPKVSVYGDVAWLIETLKEIHAGSNVSIEYRMPWKL